MPVARQRVDKSLRATQRARNNGQRPSKQASSTTQTVFSVGSLLSGYKRRIPKLELLRIQGQKSIEEYKDENGACPSDL
jgi:hypothetical protein